MFKVSNRRQITENILECRKLEQWNNFFLQFDLLD